MAQLLGLKRAPKWSLMSVSESVQTDMYFTD